MHPIYLLIQSTLPWPSSSSLSCPFLTFFFIVIICPLSYKGGHRIYPLEHLVPCRQVQASEATNQNLVVLPWSVYKTSGKRVLSWCMHSNEGSKWLIHNNKTNQLLCDKNKMREEEDDVKTIIHSSERQIMRLTSTTDQFTVQLPFLITF